MTARLEVLTLDDGDLSVDVLPARGLDLAQARLRGKRFTWESPLGHIPWQGDFARSFGGGLLVTCGLRNVGTPSEGQPQHGWYSSQAARDVAADRATARGHVVDADVPGPTLVLERELRVESGLVRVRDLVRNHGWQTEAAPLLYHVNLLWGEVAVDSSDVLPRDDDARALDWRALGPPGPERVYEHVGATHAVVTNDAARVTVRSSQPRLWQWVHPGYRVTAFEPANCSVLGRAHDRAEGRLPVLEPGEARESWLEIRVDDP